MAGRVERGAWRAAEPLWSSGPEAVGGPPPATSPDWALTCPSPADRKPPLSAALGEAEPPGPVDASELPKVQIPPPAHPAPVHQPPPLPHRPPPPPPSSYITGMSTSSSYMSGEGYQSLQSMMKTDGPSFFLFSLQPTNPRITTREDQHYYKGGPMGWLH